MRNRVFKVPDALESRYKGAGYALAAIMNGQLIDIRYFDDILPDFDPDMIHEFVTDDRLAPVSRELSVLGEVSVGMCGGWEFIEL
jgi:hypothetical protein